MRLFDLHSHWGTRRGYVLQTPEELARQEKTWGSKPSYDTEEQMAEYFRKNGVRAILDFGFTKSLSLEQIRPYHDYAIETQRRFPDVVFGHWLQIDPRTGRDGAAEMRRCISASDGFIGYCVSAAGMGFPASDPIYDPFYELSLEARRPVLVLVGHTGSGAGLPGGKGIKLELCHPRYVDELAIRFPELKIITGRPAWPWQDEMIAVLLHKANVYNELSGWSPRYFTPAFKKEINGRLQDKFMFGSDYPVLSHDRLFQDWDSENIKPEVLEKVFYKNAQRVLNLIK